MIVPTRKTSGFTLLSLLLVLMALAVVASLAIPAWFDGSGRTLENAARLLAQDLREAQNRAAFDGREMRVEFREDGDGYRILDGQDRPEPAPLGKGPFARKYSFDGIFRGVKVAQTELGDDRILDYDSCGFATEGGRIVLTFRDQTLTLVIEKGSGLLSIEGLDWIDPGN